MPTIPVKGVEQVYTPKRGKWYRVGFYARGAKSHRICDIEPDIFWCGRLVWPDPDLLDTVEGGWWMGEENRQSGKCGDCRARAERHDGAEALRRRAREAAEGQVLYDRVVTFDDLMEIAREQDAIRAAKAVL